MACCCYIKQLADMLCASSLRPMEATKLHASPSFHASVGCPLGMEVLVIFCYLVDQNT